MKVERVQPRRIEDVVVITLTLAEGLALRQQLSGRRLDRAVENLLQALQDISFNP